MSDDGPKTVLERKTKTTSPRKSKSGLYWNVHENVHEIDRIAQVAIFSFAMALPCDHIWK